jgi:hypothetical protein
LEGEITFSVSVHIPLKPSIFWSRIGSKGILLSEAHLDFSRLERGGGRIGGEGRKGGVRGGELGDCQISIEDIDKDPIL